MGKSRSRAPEVRGIPPAGREQLLSAGRRRRRQGGFTLIELLVVISILGILAAIVTLSVVGVTRLAQSRADDDELMTVQSAMNFMLTDQLVDPDIACSSYPGPAAGTSDMSRFPSTRPFVASGGSGQPTAQQPVQLYPHYLRQKVLHHAYRCVSNGAVVRAG